MAQLFRTIHGVNRHHHGVGTRYRIVRNNQLRTILHNDEYTIPACDPEESEACSETFCGGQEFGVADLAIKEDQRRSVWIPPGANSQAIP